MSPRDPENQDGPIADPPRGAVPDDRPIRATLEMCHYCFDLLVTHLIASHELDDDAIPTFAHSLPPSAECPLFVTWDKERPSRHSSSSAWPSSSSLSSPASPAASRQREFELRGCIGTLAPRPLRTAIGEYALTSAFRDRRFDPIGRHEVPRLRVAVSLLVDYEECRHCHDWTVGVHGIIIRFTLGSSQYSATYLPEVAAEQGWDQEAAVTALIRKAGFSGEVGSKLLRRIHCTRYQSSKHRLTYGDYVSKTGADPLLAREDSEKDDGGASPPPAKQSRWRFPFNL